MVKQRAEEFSLTGDFLPLKLGLPAVEALPALSFCPAALLEAQLKAAAASLVEPVCHSAGASIHPELV